MRRFFACFFCLFFLGIPVQAEETPKYVALTFDDGPSGRFTRVLLDGLEARNAKATFLLCGYRLEQYPELAERMVKEGHEIGLHGFSHDCMGCMCRETLRKELEKSKVLLPKNCAPGFLRPPGGSISENVRREAETEGLAILTWNVDPRDWAVHNATQVQKAVLDKVKDGDVVLLHDMSDSSVEAALKIVDALQSRGFQFVTAGELARIRGVVPNPGEVYSSFPP